MPQTGQERAELPVQVVAPGQVLRAREEKPADRGQGLYRSIGDGQVQQSRSRTWLAGIAVQHPSRIGDRSHQALLPEARSQRLQHTAGNGCCQRGGDDFQGEVADGGQPETSGSQHKLIPGEGLVTVEHMHDVHVSCRMRKAVRHHVQTEVQKGVGGRQLQRAQAFDLQRLRGGKERIHIQGAGPEQPLAGREIPVQLDLRQRCSPAAQFRGESRGGKAKAPPGVHRHLKSGRLEGRTRPVTIPEVDHQVGIDHGSIGNAGIDRARQRCTFEDNGRHVGRIQGPQRLGQLRIDQDIARRGRVVDRIVPRPVSHERILARSRRRQRGPGLTNFL